MEFERELDALQRWIYAAAGLKSMRLTASPPQVARPVILWQAPHRRKARDNSRWQYVNAVTQYGKLYVSNLDQLNDLQAKLLKDLEEKVGVLEVFDQDGLKIALLKEVSIEFTNSTTLDVPIAIRYEATYGRTRPTLPPPAKTVYTKIDTLGGQIKNTN